MTIRLAGMVFLSSNTQDFIEVRRPTITVSTYTAFLSSNTQDFIEVILFCDLNVQLMKFLSSNTQDFIEVSGMKTCHCIATSIPEL